MPSIIQHINHFYVILFLMRATQSIKAFGIEPTDKEIQKIEEKTKTIMAIDSLSWLTVNLVIASESCDRDLIENGIVQFWFAGNGFTEVPESDLLFRFR